MTNSFTEEVYDYLTKYGDDFYGFLMLGGMSGGGMAYIVNPERRQEIAGEIAAIMTASQKKKYQDALPFAMDPVLYNFEVNYDGIVSALKEGSAAIMPDGYYKLMMMNRIVTNKLIESADSSARVMDPEVLAFSANKAIKDIGGTPVEALKKIYSKAFDVEVDHLLISVKGKNPDWEGIAKMIKQENGFDSIAHEEMRKEIRSGKPSIEGNRFRLPPSLKMCSKVMCCRYLANGKTALASDF